MKNITTKYKWDIAISLCKQDIDFAKKLVKTINPSLNVFFYENRQEELISNSGPEAFANTFKEDCRIVVILSREEWSKSYYTEIERNAIIDRTAVKNEGYQFLMVIPMVQGEVPNWYPSTRIYADPYRFSIEELARFIEFKVTDEGGIIKSITVEDRYQKLLERIEIKKSIIKLQESEKAIKSANEEVNILKECFNRKSEFLKNKFFNTVSWLEFHEHSNTAHFGLNDYSIECKIILPDEIYQKIVTTQDFCISFEIFKTFDNNTSRESIETKQYFFYYSEHLKGWSLQYLFERASDKDLQVLFRDRNKQYYDLEKPVDSNKLVDDWLQQFIQISTQFIERYV
ncbi:MAG: hypothetical protein JXL97_18755 [Bacteroidales bacterium]|nr:hypothetical protein [Bacteroidales bacterium]